MQVYKAKTAYRICGLTPRTLNYWIEKGLIEPAQVVKTHRKGRLIFFFDLDNLVQLRAIKALRDGGVSLMKIHAAIARLTQTDQATWQREWLLGIGGELVMATDDPESFVALSGKSKGQLYFTAIAIGQIRGEVSKQLRVQKCAGDNPALYSGVADSYSRIVG
ncbi:MAG: helix-turn-helix domain-containing protein [Phycisphaeraceae bacterium]